MAKIDSFPNLKAAAEEIFLDNGFLHRGQTLENLFAQTDEILGAEGVDEADLLAMDNFIGTLTDEGLQALTTGEAGDMERFTQRAPDPEKLDGLLNDIFEHDYAYPE